MNKCSILEIARGIVYSKISINNLKRRILIDETNKVIAELYRDALEEEGFYVILSSNTRKTVELANLLKPDLIISDLNKSRREIAFLFSLKKAKATSDIPIVICSNNKNMEIVKILKSEGALDYWFKDSMTIINMVKKVKEFFRK